MTIVINQPSRGGRRRVSFRLCWPFKLRFGLHPRCKCIGCAWASPSGRCAADARQGSTFRYADSRWNDDGYPPSFLGQPTHLDEHQAPSAGLHTGLFFSFYGKRNCVMVVHLHTQAMVIHFLRVTQRRVDKCLSSRVASALSFMRITPTSQRPMPTTGAPVIMMSSFRKMV
jgi:hypothetical protein